MITFLKCNLDYFGFEYNVAAEIVRSTGVRSGQSKQCQYQTRSSIALCATYVDLRVQIEALMVRPYKALAR